MDDFSDFSDSESINSDDELDSLEFQGNDLHYSARVTNIQFAALAHHLRLDRLAEVPTSVIKAPQFKQGAGYDRSEVSKWLNNAWNTEAVLRQQSALDEDAKRFALQWAFPQAYYACYCQVLAFFVASGQTQRTHAAVMKGLGALVRDGKYPKEISWFANGGKNEIQVNGVRKGTYPSPLYYEESEQLSVETQIAQFLKSTREKALIEKRADFKFVTSKGKPRKNLTSGQWGHVSDAIGPTTLLNCLYRKRIKANYNNIDTFLSASISGARIMDDLIAIVHAVALIHESMLVGILGGLEVGSVVERARCRYAGVGERIKSIEDSSGISIQSAKDDVL